MDGGETKMKTTRDEAKQKLKEIVGVEEKGIVCINGKTLLENYQGAKGEVIKKISDWKEYFSKNPFKTKYKRIFLDSIKDELLFENLNYKKQKEKEIEKKKIERAEERGKKVIELGKEIVFFVDKHDLAKQFIEIKPLYYDKNKLWWMWNEKEFRWLIIDEIDILNSIKLSSQANIINSTERKEIITALKQNARMNQPKETKKSWIQFKDKIYDIKNGKNFKATPEYFITNPIPWSVGESEETPTIDKLFLEWVGEKYKENLYEITAYNTTINKFMQRIFAFCGGGSNGKGTYIKLIEKFLGEDNCVSSEIKAISERQFEPVVLYRKLLCVMGEVSHDDLRNTNIIKKIAGEDRLSFEFKGKTPFTDDNTATCICLTNSLAITPDKSLGFYRKWFILDFPNQFTDINKNLIDTIPEVEFNNLARKCLNVLKKLYKTQTFSNDGDFEERIKRYEERSNPVLRFVEQECLEIEGDKTISRTFTNACNEYLKEKHLRVMTANQINKILRDAGFTVGIRKIDDISHLVILNLFLKTHKQKQKKL